MAQGIGIKFYLEGNPELNQQIKETTEAFKTVKTEIAAVASAYDTADESTEKLTKVNESLTKSVEIQEKRLDALKQGLAIVQRETGGTSSETKKWEQAINRATAELNKTNRQIENNNKTIAENEKALQDAEKATDSFENSIKNIEDSLSSLNSELKLAKSEYAEGEDASSSLTKQTEILNRMIQEQSKKVQELTSALDKSAKETGDNSDETRKLQMRLNDAKTELNGMVRQLDQTKDALKQSEKGFSENTQTIGDFKDSIMNANPVLAGLVTTAIAAGKKILDVAKNAASAADDLNTLSKVTGISTDELQKMEYAAAQVDVSIEDISDALKETTARMKEAEDGSSETADALYELGVKTRDSKGEMRPAIDVFKDIIDALGKVRNETERNQLAMQMFGESARNLNPLIEAGADAFERYGQELEDANLVLTPEELNSLNAMNDQIDRMNSLFDALGKVFSLGVAESVTPILEDLNKMLLENGDSFRTLGDIVGGLVTFCSSMVLPVIQGISDGLKLINDLITKLVEWVNKLTGMNLSNSDFFKMIAQFATGNVSGLINTLQGAVPGTTPVSKGFASGTASAPPGTAWVGENGPELVNFRGGEQVMNKEQILRAALEGGAGRSSGGDVYNITINADIRQLKDVQALIDSVKRSRQVGRAKGCRV